MIWKKTCLRSVFLAGLVSMNRLILFSAPSGTGKNTIIKEILAQRKNLAYSVSTTTRKNRPGEKNGVHYWFISIEQFRKEIDGNAFLEYAEVLGNFYGTSRREIDRILSDGKTPVMDIDVQGARILLQKKIPMLTIFLKPPSIEILRQRLTARGTESAKEIERRIQLAIEEIHAEPEFDYAVTNDLLEKAIAEVLSIIDREIPSAT